MNDSGLIAGEGRFFQGPFGVLAVLGLIVLVVGAVTPFAMAIRRGLEPDAAADSACERFGDGPGRYECLDRELRAPKFRPGELWPAAIGAATAALAIAALRHRRWEVRSR